MSSELHSSGSQSPGSPSIESLWRKRLRVLMANLAEGSREHEEIHNLSREVTLDYHGRFLIELIQNAVDALPEDKPGKIHLILTPSLLAVLNQGQPFSPEGLEAITSMALSPKRADESIGNKGIGFKSVFEVSDAPELYSVAALGRSLAQLPSTRWRISLKPLEQPRIVAYTEQLISTLLAEDPPLKRRLQARFPGDIHNAVLEGFQRSAPFRYPLSLSEEVFRVRVQELQLSDEVLAQFQTLVVLPIKPSANENVQKLFAAQWKAGFSLMTFLPRADWVTFEHHRGVDDRLTVELHRRDGTAIRKADATFKVREISALKREVKPREPKWRSLTRAPEVTEKTQSVRYWMATTVLESARTPVLREALRRLEASSWSQVQRLAVSVALRFPEADSLKLSGSGHFVVGLPTQVETGVPISMDAHFYASLSRTRLDLDLPLNRVLFDAGVSLVEALWQQLQSWSGLSSEEGLLAKLAATLMFERSKGPLADALFDEGGLASRAVALKHDASGFVPVSQMLLPASEDLPMMRQALNLGAEFSPEPWGYRLPHPKLDSRLELLKSLGATQEEKDKVQGIFTELPQKGSLIHHWARQGRRRGEEFWQMFLAWVLSRFDEKTLEKEAFLPTGTSALSRIGNTVLIPPLAAHEQEPARSDIPSKLFEYLHFLDERAIRLRKDNGEFNSPGKEWTKSIAAGWQRTEPHKTSHLRACVFRLGPPGSAPGR